MAINVGNRDATAGLSKAIYGQWVADSWAGFHSAFASTPAMQQIVKANVWAIANQVGTAVNNDLGALTTPVVATCRSGVGESVPHDTHKRINFETVDVDSHTAITTGSDAWKFTVPAGQAGRYLVSGFVSLYNGTLAAGNNQANLYLFKNGVLTHRLGRTELTKNSAMEGLGGSVILDLVAGDQVYLTVYQFTMSTWSIEAWPFGNHVSIFRVGVNASGGGGGTVPTFVDGETPTGTIDGVNATFTLANAPSPATSLILYLNGVRLRVGTHYTLSGATITYLAGSIPQTGDAHVADYRR